MLNAKTNAWYDDGDINDLVTNRINTDKIAGGFEGPNQLKLKDAVDNQSIIVLPPIRARTNNAYNASSVTIERFFGKDGLTVAAARYSDILDSLSVFSKAPKVTPEQIKMHLLSLKLCKAAFNKFSAYKLDDTTHTYKDISGEFSRNFFKKFLEEEMAKPSTSSDDKVSLKELIDTLKSLEAAISWEEVKNYLLVNEYRDIIEELDKYHHDNGRFINSSGEEFDLNKIVSYLKNIIDSRRGSVNNIESLITAGQKIKVLFPYNTGSSGSDTSGYHWTTGEITIDQSAPDVYEVKCTAHDPLQNHVFTKEDLTAIEKKLNELAQEIARNTLASGATKSVKFIVQGVPSSYTVKRQFDSSSCGPIVAEELIERITSKNLNKIYPASEAVKLREKQLQFMLQANRNSGFVKHLSEAATEAKAKAKDSDIPVGTTVKLVASNIILPPNDLEKMAKNITIIENTYQVELAHAKSLADVEEMAASVNAANVKRNLALQEVTMACTPNKDMEKFLLDKYERQKQEHAKLRTKLEITIAELLYNNKRKVYWVLALTFVLTLLQAIQTALSAKYCPSTDSIPDGTNANNSSAFVDSLTKCNNITISCNALILIIGAVGTLLGGIYAVKNNFNDTVKPEREEAVKKAEAELKETETALIKVMVHNGSEVNQQTANVFAAKLEARVQPLVDKAEKETITEEEGTCSHLCNVLSACRI